MPDQRLSPRVEDAQEADLRAQVLGIPRDLEQRGRTRLKEQCVDECRVSATQRQQRVWQGEDDVDVRDVEQLTLARRQPPLARLRLALRTVPIPTRIVRKRPMSGAALIDMPTEASRPTSVKRAQHGALLHAHPRMPLEEVLTLRVEDIGHLHGGSRHDWIGFRKRRDRGSTTGRETCSCSKGFGAACR